VIARALAVALAIGAAPAGAQPPEPDGYRMEAFRSPVPATLSGATVVDTSTAETLWREERAIFVDVLPRPVRPADLPEGTVWRDKPRDTIPGATWLPNTGFGALHPQTDTRFRAALAGLAGGDSDAPLLFFCLADCWMSWNAAKRAREEYGYSSVFWYPDGTDGWAAAGLPLERVAPAEGF
jgi:PQQ-dependent catabolism-associated CXXCW motif protein